MSGDAPTTTETAAKVPTPRRAALGRGLGALLGETRREEAVVRQPGEAAAAQGEATVVVGRADGGLMLLPVSQIEPHPDQPRRHFDETALNELAASIAARGVIQPVVVRPLGGNRYQLVAGERRWRASQLLGLPEVPVIVRIADDRAVLELALIENLQRENLNSLEEALGYAQLGEQFQLTQEEIAVKVGKSRAAVANATRLLKLPAPVQSFLRTGRISVGHAKVLLGLPDEKSQQHAAERVVKDGLNVRQTEGLVAKLQSRAAKLSPDNAKTPAMVPIDANIGRLEANLREKFGTKVHLKYAKGKGAVEISFFSDDELQRVLEILGVNAD